MNQVFSIPKSPKIWWHFLVFKWHFILIKKAHKASKHLFSVEWLFLYSSNRICAYLISIVFLGRRGTGTILLFRNWNNNLLFLTNTHERWRKSILLLIKVSVKHGMIELCWELSLVLSIVQDLISPPNPSWLKNSLTSIIKILRGNLKLV